MESNTVVILAIFNILSLSKRTVIYTFPVRLESPSVDDLIEHALITVNNEPLRQIENQFIRVTKGRLR